MMEVRDIASVAGLVALPLGAIASACWSMLNAKIEEAKRTAQEGKAKAEAVHLIVLSEFTRQEDMHRTIRTVTDPMVAEQKKTHELLLKIAGQMHVTAVLSSTQ